MREASELDIKSCQQTLIVPTLIIGDPQNHYHRQLEEIQEKTEASTSLIEILHSKRQATALEEIIRKLKSDYSLSEDLWLSAVQVRIYSQRRLGEFLATVKSTQKYSKLIKEVGISLKEATLCKRFAKPPKPIFDSALTQLRSSVKKGEYKTISSTRLLTEIQTQLQGKKKVQQYSPIIKPSDNWNFSSVRYSRIDKKDNEWGYIPGDLYANCLWYYAQPGDVVVVPMAGTGQIQRVYDDRIEWLSGNSFELDIILFDLHPRGPYKDKIQKNDVTKSIPVETANYIIADIPYFGMTRQQYSDHESDIANIKDYETWLNAMLKVVKSFADVQKIGDKCTIITPNYRNISGNMIHMVTNDICSIWTRNGYKLFDKAYSSRRIQQKQGPAMARMNRMAKSRKIMLTDISEILTFEMISR